MGREEVLRGGLGLGRLGHSELTAHDTNLRKLFRHDLLKPRFPISGRNTAGDVSQHGDVALILNKLRQFARGHFACFRIVGREKCHVLRRTYSGIEHGNGNADARGSLNHAVQRGVVRRRYPDSIDMAGDHGIDNLDLTAEIGLERRPVP